MQLGLIPQRWRRVPLLICVILLSHLLDSSINGQQATLWAITKPSNRAAPGFHYYPCRPNVGLALRSAHQQSSSQAVYYGESWKKGSRTVQEQKVEIELDTKHRTYETRIKDASGKERYTLKVEPALTDSHDSSIGAWDVSLTSPSDTFSLLAVHNQSHQHDFTQADFLDCLYPVENPDWRKTGFFGVPLSAKRVIKVEGFYCIIQVKSYHLSSTNRRAIDALSLEIQFTNTYRPT